MYTKVIKDPEFGEIILKKNPRCRRINVRIHPERGIGISLPTYLPYSAALDFLESCREKVRQILERQKKAGGQQPALSGQDILKLRKEAKQWLPQRLESLAQKYGFSYGRVAIKNNRTNWGSCSARNNINLNLHLMRLPEHLRDYVILHELCHLRHHNHGKEFHRLLESICIRHFSPEMEPDTEISKCRSECMEKEIKKYKI